MKDERLREIYGKILAPCVVSLPVKSKITKSFTMKIKLKPMDQAQEKKVEDKLNRKLQKMRHKDEKKFKKYILDLVQSKNYAQVAEALSKKEALESRTPKTVLSRSKKFRES